MTNPTTPTDLQRLAGEAAERMRPHLDPYFQLNRDWKEQVASIIVEVFAGFSPDAKEIERLNNKWQDYERYLLLIPKWMEKHGVVYECPAGKNIVEVVLDFADNKFDAEYVRGYKAAREQAALVAEAATLPKGYQWGHDAMEQFNFGKECAATAVRALLPTESRLPAQPDTLKQLDEKFRAESVTHDVAKFAPERCLDCGHTGWMDYASGVCHWKPGRETALENICGCHCRFPQPPEAQSSNTD